MTRKPISANTSLGIDNETGGNGEHQLRWHAGALSSGIYLLGLEAGNNICNIKVAVIK